MAPSSSPGISPNPNLYISIGLGIGIGIGIGLSINTLTRLLSVDLKNKCPFHSSTTNTIAKEDDAVDKQQHGKEKEESKMTKKNDKNDHVAVAVAMESNLKSKKVSTQSKAKAKDNSTSEHGMNVVVQRVNSAEIVVDNVDDWRSIRRGLVVYLSMNTNATDETMDRAAKAIVSLPLVTLGEWGDGTKPLSIVDSVLQSITENDETKRVSVMVVPQASLTAKFRGKSIKYHEQLAKEEGRIKYLRFMVALERAVLDGVLQQMFKLHINLPLAIGMTDEDRQDEWAVQAIEKEYTAFDKRGVPTAPFATKLEKKQVDRIYKAIQTFRQDKLLPAQIEFWQQDVVNENKSCPHYHPIIIVAGTFGNRQGLRLVSECGPSTHTFNF